MKLLGKIFLLVIISLNIYGAQAFLSKESITQGERVVLVIRASGKDIKFPQIDSIEGFNITSTGMQQSIEYVNGSISKNIEKHYEFLPTKSIDIPPFEVEVNGKKELTNSLHVNVGKATLQNSKFLLEVKAKKTDVMQFEAIPIEFIFKRHISEDVRDLRFAPPKFDNFWVKEGKKVQAKQEGNFIVHKMNFFIFPQKSGDFELSPAQVDVGVRTQGRDIFNMLTNQLSWKSVFSNSLSLHVNKLEGANLYGNFDIKASVDKTSIDANEGVNLTIKITGNGNFDDIEAYDIKINKTNIYADKPVVKSEAYEDRVKGEFTQKFSISASEDFSIQPLQIRYYDKDLKKVVTKQTEKIDIHVNNVNVERSIQITPSEQKTVKVEVLNYTYIVFAFIGGILVTLLLIGIVYFFKKQEFKVPKFKNDKELLQHILKYRGKSQEIDKQISALEENLYANGKNKIDKKGINKFIKSYEE